MGPRVSLCRKGENIFLTIEGEISNESMEELFVVVRQLLLTSLKCIAPGSRVTYSLKTRSTLDLKRMTQLQPTIEDQPGDPEACEGLQTGQQQGLPSPPGESVGRRARHGLFLIKGGLFELDQKTKKRSAR
jgi:hypothetical protein